MDNLRFFLFAALIFVGFLLWQAWQEDYGRRAAEPPTAAEQPADAQPARSTGREDVPSAPRDDATRPSAGEQEQPAGAPADALPTGRRIRVETDVLVAEIDTAGGDIRRLELKNYALAADRPDTPYPLLAAKPDRLQVAQNGLLAEGSEAPTHHATFRAEDDTYTLDAGADVVTVPLTWTGPDGLEVSKRYTFHRSRYTVDVAFEVRNRTGAAWRGRQYTQIQRRHDEAAAGGLFAARTFTGGAYYTDSYNKRGIDDLREEPVEVQTQGGWAAVVQHYFLAAALPPADSSNYLYGRVLENDRYVMGAVGPSRSVPAGETATLSSRLYLGPKLQERLGEVAKGLELTVDYGIFTILSKPLFWLLSWLHAVLGNWGWAIVGLTVLIKAVFYKLSEQQYRSMAKMREFAPRIKALRERYGDDKQRLNQEMIELYRKEKFNPLGGCLPILVQLPVFIALYWVLLESVELRHADFMLWIDDLTSPDPYYVLPVLFGVSMYAQQKMSASAMTMDPIQQRIMSFMPVGLTVFFAFFPSGLVLYWLVNNVLSIAQQWVIMRRMESPRPAT